MAWDHFTSSLKTNDAENSRANATPENTLQKVKFFSFALKVTIRANRWLTMHKLIQAVLNSDEKTDLEQLVDTFRAAGSQYLLRNDILRAFTDYCEQHQKPAYFYHSSSLGKLISYTHEMILAPDSSVWLLARPRVGSQENWRLGANLETFEQVSPQAILDIRDRTVNRYQPGILEIDFRPFYRDSPTIDDPRNMGQGLAFLNRYLCNQLLNDRNHWLEVLFNTLQRLKYDSIPLLINDRLKSGAELWEKLKQAIKLVGELPKDEKSENFRALLQELGFEPGWGNTASRVRETLELFDRLIDTPSPPILEAFVARVPTLFRVVLVSIHGWVSQNGVSGRSETRGQVSYILEQARNLENKLQEEIFLAGLDGLGIHSQVIILTRLIPNCEGTQCDLRLEKIAGTENGWILRVPFGEFNPEVTQNWISKFEIWPYLESFAQNAEKELLAQLRGRPNLIIGNYSDGCLVAFLLARRLKVTQCNIAHSLEKPKHLFSSLHWQELEEKYHFSAQFTADIISMNAADFIITSSYQEIVGTPDTIGQYESYKCFSMPELYHVVDGIDLLSPKFNMIPPGVDEHIFFPYSQKENRVESLRLHVQDLLFNREDPQIYGHLEHPHKRPICSIAPVSTVKNISGLVECFGQSQELQEHCNLILVTTKLHRSEAINPEEDLEIEKIDRIIQQYNLQGKIRWLGLRLPNVELGEIYRVLGDREGIFIHFARFESFGRTVLEAMSSGLPTFATKFGGASEIVEEEFQINPTTLTDTSAKIVKFTQCCDANPKYWQEVSERSRERVQYKYNWQEHTKQLLLISKVYIFWDLVTQDNQEALLCYLDTLYHLLYKPQIQKILDKHMQRTFQGDK